MAVFQNLSELISETFGVRLKIAKGIAVGLAVLGGLSLVLTVRACYNDEVIEEHEQKVYKELVESKIKADEAASEQRVKDAIREAELANTRKEVINEAKDQALPESSIKLGCQRLRDQGYNTSRFPECN